MLVANHSVLFEQPAGKDLGDGFLSEPRPVRRIDKDDVEASVKASERSGVVRLHHSEIAVQPLEVAVHERHALGAHVHEDHLVRTA